MCIYFVWYYFSTLLCKLEIGILLQKEEKKKTLVYYKYNKAYLLYLYLLK